MQQVFLGNSNKTYDISTKKAFIRADMLIIINTATTKCLKEEHGAVSKRQSSSRFLFDDK